MLLATVLSGGVGAKLLATRAANERDARQHVATQAALAGTFTADYVRDFAARERLLARRRLAGAVTQAIYTRVVEDLGASASVLLDARGRVLFTYPPNPDAVGSPAAARYPHLARALAGAVGVSPVSLTISRNTAAVGVAVSFASVTGRRVFSNAISPGRGALELLLRNVSESEGARVMVVDDQGSLIVPAPDGMTLAAVAGEDVASRALSGDGSRRFGDAGRIVAVAPVRGTPWSVVAVAPEAHVYAGVESAWIPALLWLLFAGGAYSGVLLVFWSARSRDQRVDALSKRDDALSRLDTVMINVADGLLALEADGTVTSMNAAAEALLGWELDELRGLPMHDTIHHRGPDGRPCRADECSLDLGRRTGSPVVAEDDVFIRRDGTALEVSYTGSPLGNESSEGYVVVFRDIAAIKRREAEIRDQLEAFETLTAIREALDEDRFVLYAQPIVAAATGTIEAHELLIRMITREGRVASPSEFLPVAERHGLIREIDRWVIGQAMRYIRAGHAVEINLSAVSFADSDIFHVLERELREAGADPRLLVIEITETAVLDNPGVASAIIRDLKRLGCRVALDDFGTGYAGFSTLKSLPLDYLKIDIEFVRDLVAVEASRHVVEAIVDLARRFGNETVAEGVEDQATLDALHSLEVDYAQGYHLGRPAPAEALLADIGWPA